MEAQNIGKAMPFMVFCAVSLLAFLLDLLLPETNKRVLPDTIEEAKLFGLSTEAAAIFSHSGTVNYGALRSSGASDPSYDDLIYPAPGGANENRMYDPAKAGTSIVAVQKDDNHAVF